MSRCPSKKNGKQIQSSTRCNRERTAETIEPRPKTDCSFSHNSSSLNSNLFALLKVVIVINFTTARVGILQLCLQKITTAQKSAIESAAVESRVGKIMFLSWRTVFQPVFDFQAIQLHAKSSSTTTFMQVSHAIYRMRESGCFSHQRLLKLCICWCFNVGARWENENDNVNSAHDIFDWTVHGLNVWTWSSDFLEIFQLNCMLLFSSSESLLRVTGSPLNP